MVYPGVFNHDADSSFCMSIQTLSWSSFRFWSICILMHAGVVLSSHARLLLPFALSCCVYSWRFSSHWSNDNLVIELRGMYGICTNLRCVPMRYCSGYKSIFFYLFNLLFFVRMRIFCTSAHYFSYALHMFHSHHCTQLWRHSPVSRSLHLHSRHRKKTAVSRCKLAVITSTVVQHTARTSTFHTMLDDTLFREGDREDAWCLRAPNNLLGVSVWVRWNSFCLSSCFLSSLNRWHTEAMYVVASL